MHIAFLTPEYPHPKVKHAAGLGTSIKNLAEALCKENIKVTLFIYSQNKEDVFEENGIVFHLIQDKNYKYLKWLWYRKYIQKYVNQVINAQKIDLIEAPDWTGVTAFMSFDIPLVVRFHGSDTYFCHLEKRKQKWRNRFFETLAVRKAKAWIAPTQFAGNVSANLFGLSKSKVITIHYGLDLAQFENDQPEIFEKGLILYIGTLIRKKGVFELPEIFKHVRAEFPEAKLILIGGDSKDIQTGNVSTWKMVEQLFSIEDLKNVSYLGKIPYQEVQEYIKKANVCAFPTYAETLGMVTIESMALQKPVVNSNIGWANELMIDEESGFLVHPENHEEYARRIVQILEDENLQLKMGKLANEFISKRFDIQKIVLENIKFYKKIIIK